MNVKVDVIKTACHVFCRRVTEFNHIEYRGKFEHPPFFKVLRNISSVKNQLFKFFLTAGFIVVIFLGSQRKENLQHPQPRKCHTFTGNQLPVADIYFSIFSILITASVINSFIDDVSPVSFDRSIIIDD